MLRRLLLVALGLAALGATFLAGAFAYKYRAAIRGRLQALQGSDVIQTSLYNLRVQKLNIPAEGRDGGIAALGEGVLFVNRNGRSWYVTPERQLQEVGLVVPINAAEFAADPFNANTTDQDRFSVKDILIQPIASGIRIAAAYMYWHSDRRCNALRVSVTETTQERLLTSGGGPGTWRTVFESAPCRELIETGDGRTRHVTLGAGGRLIAMSENELLLSVGEFSAEYEAGTSTDSSVVDSYGKTMRIPLDGGRAREFTKGHRNQQGLAIGSDGRIWSTEHGSRGGDELNLLVEGRNYGAPNVTYGTQYEMMVWPRSKTQGRHDGYEKPMLAWVPSIATSQLVVLTGKAFPWWTGDLMVSTLQTQSVYRVRIEDGRAIFAEPIVVGHRVRDIAEAASGSLVLKTDDNFLVFLDNLDQASPEDLPPETRGAIVAGQCRSCHAVQEGAPSGLGPNLHGVVGRRVASLPGYAYSDALKRAGGQWSDDRLRSFIANPGSAIPGTRMLTTTTYTDQQLTDLLAYLRTLR